MNSTKLTLAAIFTLVSLVGTAPVAAQSAPWSAAATSANAAREQGDNAAAATFYKQAIEIQKTTLGATTRKSRSASTTWRSSIRISQCIRRPNSLTASLWRSCKRIRPRTLRPR